MRRLSGAITFGLFLSVQVIAQETPTQEPRYTTQQFEEALKYGRGSFYPLYEQASYLSKELSCSLVKAEWGWNTCDGLEFLVVTPSPSVDTVVLETPNSDGYVSYTDWDSSDRDEEIDTIWSQLVANTEAQSEVLGVKITAEKWLVYPTLDKKNNYLYYATLLNWDGQPTVNVKASLFDRRGYASFNLIPMNAASSPEQLKAMIDETLEAYKPNVTESYASFVQGDKVAEHGTLGVLAALVGVKYGKTALLALLPFLKKFWFVFLLPFVFLKDRIFGRKDSDEPSSTS